jgi:hypothetical protein
VAAARAATNLFQQIASRNLPVAVVDAIAWRDGARLTSGLGQKRRFKRGPTTSGLPLITDCRSNCPFGPFRANGSHSGTPAIR